MALSSVHFLKSHAISRHGKNIKRDSKSEVEQMYIFGAMTNHIRTSIIYSTSPTLHHHYWWNKNLIMLHGIFPGGIYINCPLKAGLVPALSIMTVHGK